MRDRTTKSNPATIALGLLAAAGVFGGAILLAMHLQGESPARAPIVGAFGDDETHTLRVVVADPGTTWSGLEVRTDVPAVIVLAGDHANPTYSPGGTQYVPISSQHLPVAGGDDLRLCSMTLPGPTRISVRDGATYTIVFEQTLELDQCDGVTRALLGKAAA